MSRAEVLKIAYTADGEDKGDYSGSSGFSDVSASDWFYDYVVDAREKGYIKSEGLPECTNEKDNALCQGTGGSCFCPNDSATRAESIKIISDVFQDKIDQMPYLNVASEGSWKYFPDMEGHWAEDFVNWITNVKICPDKKDLPLDQGEVYLGFLSPDCVPEPTVESIVKGYKNGNFGPNDHFTREQIAKVIRNMMLLVKYNYDPWVNSSTQSISLSLQNLAENQPYSGSSYMGHLYEQISDPDNLNAPEPILLSYDDNQIFSQNGFITFDKNETVDADGHEMFYFWSANGGTFTTNDYENYSNMTWYPPEVSEETTFSIKAIRGDGKGKVDHGEFQITVVPNQISNISVTPSSYNFGGITTGESKTAIFTVSNKSQEDLTIGMISQSGSHNSEFSIGADDCSDTTLSFLESCNVQVEFSPTYIGPKTVTLAIPSNDPATPITSVELRGSGKVDGLLQYVAGGIVDSDDGDKVFEAGEDAEFEVWFQRTGTSSPQTIIHFSVLNLDTGELRLLNDNCTIPAMPTDFDPNLLMDACSVSLSADNDLPPGEYQLYIVWAEEGSIKSTTEEIAVVNEFLPNFVVTSAEHTITRDPGASFDWEFVLLNRGKGFSSDLPLFRVYRESDDITQPIYQIYNDVRHYGTEETITYTVSPPSVPGTYRIYGKINPEQSIEESDYADNTSAVLTLVVRPPVVANFNANPSSGMVPLEVAFSDQSEGDITSWLWNFGDGTTSTEPNPTHTYTEIDKYTVSLAVTGPKGSDTKTRTDYISVGRIPAMEIEETKILAEDGTYSDMFGYSVAIDDDYAIVGTLGDADNGKSSGAAYIFKREGDTWVQMTRLIPTDNATGDYFGFSVSISGEYAIVGAPGDADHGKESGSAYIFKRDGDNWVQQPKLTAIDSVSYDWFGSSVSISSEYAFVGTHRGELYIFQRTGNSWIQQTRLDGGLGFSVSIFDDYVISGGNGAVYILKRAGDTWVQEAKLTADDVGTEERFGWPVAISGEHVIVGARYDNDKGESSGSAYIFKREGNVWIQEAKLLANDGAAFDYFGSSVSISGEYAIVGTGRDDDYGPESGAAYLFKRDGNIWIQVRKLTASDAAARDWFGESVAFSGNSAIIGAKWDDDKGYKSGSAYIYEIVSPTRITPEGGTVIVNDASVYFPADAVPDDVFVYIVKLTEASIPPLTGCFELLGDVYNFIAVDEQGNPVTQFNQTLELNFQYDYSDGVLEQDLTILYYDYWLGEWLAIPSEFDEITGYGKGFTDHFTPFALFGLTIPEPGTLILFGIGLLGLLGFGLRRWRKRR